MSHRPIEQKKRRRVAKALRRKPLPAYFDLVEFLVSRSHAKSKRAARDLILAKKVRADSHTLGVTKAMVPGKTALLDVLSGREPTMVEEEVVAPLIDAKLRTNVTVLP